MPDCWRVYTAALACRLSLRPLSTNAAPVAELAILSPRTTYLSIFALCAGRCAVQLCCYGDMVWRATTDSNCYTPTGPFPTRQSDSFEEHSNTTAPPQHGCAANLTLRATRHTIRILCCAPSQTKILLGSAQVSPRQPLCARVGNALLGRRSRLKMCYSCGHALPSNARAHICVSILCSTTTAPLIDVN